MFGTLHSENTNYTRIRINMSSKIYNGLTGVLKIICALFVGAFIGGVAIYDIIISIPYMGVSYVRGVFKLLFLLLATGGYFAIIVRGFYQIKSLFISSKVNVAELLCINVLSLLSIIAVSSTYILYMSLLFDEKVFIVELIIYALSIALVILDVVFQLVEIKREKIKVFNETNCMIIINKISRIVVPIIIIVIVISLIVMIISNLKKIKEDEALSNGFNSFVMTDFDGREYTEDIFKGHKVTMINVWGTFCHPCIEEMPELEEIFQMYDEKDLQLIGLAGDLYSHAELDQGQKDLALDIVERTGVTYPILIPSKGLQAGVIDAILCYPTTIFFDENGNQLDVVEGAGSKEQWIEVIEEVLANEEGNR